MTDQVSCQVLVVGLGPVGATLSALLADAGVNVLAVDKSPEIYPLPRAAHFDHEIMRIFQQLGLAEAVLPHTRVAKGYEFRNAKGEILFSVRGNPDEIAPGGWAPSYMFNQPGLEGALRSKLKTLSRLKLHLGVEFKSLQNSATGVQATLMAEGRTFAVNADYLVGCDGAWSPVREAIGIKLQDLKFDEPWLVVDTIPRPGSLLPDLNLQICDPDRPTTCVPMGPGRHRWEFMLRPGETSEQVLQESFIRDLLSTWDVDVEIDRRAVYRFHGLVADCWRKDRVLIAGDAAHQTPPFAGQGMCAGIRDAANLGWKVAAVLAGQASSELLDTYQVEREPNVRAYIELAIAMGRVVCTLDPEVARVRDEKMLSGAKFIDVAPPPFLTGPAIWTGSPGAGAAFPQPTHEAGDSKVRFDDVAGRGPWLISRRAFDTGPGPLTAIHLDDARMQVFRAKLEEWLTEHGAEAVLVRPDHYIFGSGEAAALVAAWGRISSAHEVTIEA